MAGNPSVTPRVCDLIAEGLDDPGLADFLAVEVVPRIGRPLSGTLRDAFFAGGDLPDAARLRALVSIQGAEAKDMLVACLKDGSSLLRELALEMVASKLSAEARLVDHCRKMLTPVTNMPLQAYFSGRLFSVRQGLPCRAAVKLLGSADPGDDDFGARGARQFFGNPPPLRVMPPPDDSLPQAPDLEGPMPDLPVERLLEHLAKPVSLTDLVTTIQMLGRSGDPQALEPLLEVLRKDRILDLEQVPSSHAHDALAQAIVGVGGPAAGRPLGKFVLSAASDNDYTFFSALGAIHTHRLAGAVPHLVERLRRPWSHQSTPSLLVAALCRIGGAEAARLTFEAALACDTPEKSRPHLLHAFTGLAGDLTGDRQLYSSQLLKQVPGAREGTYKTALLEALTVLGGESIAVVLGDRAVCAKSSEERAVAWRGLGQVGGPDALKILLAGLSRRPTNLSEVLAIITGIATLKDAGAIAGLTRELDRESRWQVRLALIDALGAIGSPQAVPRLQAEEQHPAYTASAPTAWTRQVQISVKSALDKIGSNAEK